jgi:hypothetical protein
LLEKINSPLCSLEETNFSYISPSWYLDKKKGGGGEEEEEEEEKE